MWSARFTIAFSNQPVVTSNQGYTVFHGKPFNMSGNAAVMWLRRARSQRWEGNSLWAIVASWPTLGGTWQSLVSCLTWTSSFVIHLCALGEKALLGAAASVDQFTLVAELRLRGFQEPLGDHAGRFWRTSQWPGSEPTRHLGSYVWSQQRWSSGVQPESALAPWSLAWRPLQN